MFKHFQDYYWKEGKPYGIHPIDPTQISPSQTSISYKIVVDPYYKRFSIEKYHFTHFDTIIYDSILLDFRRLTLKDQTAWQREVLKDEENFSLSLLRNQEDRAILLEELRFEKSYCRMCTTRSTHGIPLSVHRMHYTALNDPFNGVILYDMNKHPVMMKTYEIDPFSGEFTQLLFEEWNMQQLPEQLCLF